MSPFLIPSDPKNTWLFGFSAARLVMAAGLTFICLTFLYIYISQQKNWRSGEIASRFSDSQIRRRLLASAIVLLGLGCILYFVAWLALFPRFLGLLFQVFASCAFRNILVRPWDNCSPPL